MSQFDAEELIFRTQAVPGLSSSHARTLLSLARTNEIPPGTIVTRQGEPVAELVFIIDGAIDIRVGEQIVARCGPGDFVGEIGVVSNGPATATATATATADGPVRCLGFDAGALRRILAKDEVIAKELDLAFRHGLRQKLVRANDALAQRQVVPL